ncbi:TetR/AcrR family transcriptional regulator [Ruegeria sp. EL01]|jgi:TetR/AcrR family transcriptional repressor of nem operon|uniref:TetR/AcrR family transcriptional regulator n=1 Tax=Ruegeria sp. EL01 TaxID=2107578 RepID=UPI000EA7F310|nr:TetR/AcrR family transcriptional regulator [Ruegeria sp. EL01]
MSEAEKQKSHERILAAAADLIREKGIETTSVAEVMKTAGMTHGGFYRHFADKDELVRAAFRKAVDDVVHGIATAESTRAREAALKAYVDTYLSLDHVRNRKAGCPMAALGSELVRGSEDTSHETAKAVRHVASLLGNTGAPDDGLVRLSLLVGAVTLARLAEDGQQSEAILKAAGVAYDRL